MREAVQKALGPETVARVSRSKNRELFSKVRFVYNSKNCKSEGEYYDSIPLTGVVADNAESGFHQVTINEETMHQISTTISSKTGAGFSKGGFSISQEIAACITNTITTSRGTSFVAKLPYTIEPGTSGDVQGSIDLFIMKTQLRDVTVNFPADSQVVYKTNPVLSSNVAVSKLGEIKVSGEYTWIYPRMVARVTPIKNN